MPRKSLDTMQIRVLILTLQRFLLFVSENVMKSKRFPRILMMLALVVTFFLIGVGSVQAQNIKPVPLPDPGIPGFKFPTNKYRIRKWIKNNNQTEINKHAWGIWTALTQETDQTYDGQNLRVFETWLTPKDILAGKGNRKTPRPLGRFRQLTHGDSDTGGEETVLGFVKYNPAAARHIIDYNLLSKSTLDAMLQKGDKKIPRFSKTAISLKPVFQPIAQGDLVEERYYQMAAWPGPGKPLPGKARPFPSTDWDQCVWIDIKNEGKGKGSVDKDCDASSIPPDTIYNVSDLIHFTLTAKEANLLNNPSNGQKPKHPYAEGDFSILQGMHVTSKEIPRWTWETFWWTPNPDKPHFPSSSAIAQDRPDQLQGAARNYAVASAYSMKYPPQPKTGGKNEGNSVYAYNPWLEAGFSSSNLPDSESGTYNGNPVPNNVGIQTNCMSCHSQANYQTVATANAPNYTGDRYVDLNSSQFDGTLQVDFLWSIPGNAK